MKMLRLTITYIFTIIYFIVCYSSESKGGQRDFFTIFERMEVISKNSSLVKGTPTIKVTRFNRTSWAFNVSARFLRDIDGSNIQVTTTADMLFSNTYRFTGIQIKGNLCEIYEQNQGTIRTFFEKYSNINLCHLKKGHNYVYGWVEQMWFPEKISIPYGNFRFTSNSTFLTGGEFITLQLFLRSNKYVKQMGTKPKF